jgi:hypothetical protein
MISQILAGIFSLLGYYFIDKNPRYAYLSFTLLNITLLMSIFNIGLIINIIFSTYFLIRSWTIKTQKYD